MKSRQKNPGNLFLSSFLIFQVMCEQEGSIKVALCEVVTALMSADLNERKLAEQQLEALQVTEGKTSKISSRFAAKFTPFSTIITEQFLKFSLISI